MPAPRRKKTPKPEATASSSMDMHQLLNDIEGMKEAGAVARLAALRFKLPVYPSRGVSDPSSGLPAQIHDSKVFEETLRSFKQMWETGDEKLQSGVCIMLGKLALDDSLREKLCRGDWLCKLGCLISSTQHSAALPALNAKGELLQVDFKLCLYNKIEVGPLCAQVMTIAERDVPDKTAARMALTILVALVCHCCSCAHDSIDLDRLIRLLLSSIGSK